MALRIAPRRNAEQAQRTHRNLPARVFVYLYTVSCEAIGPCTCSKWKFFDLSGSPPGAWSVQVLPSPAMSTHSCVDTSSSFAVGGRTRSATFTFTADDVDRMDPMTDLRAPVDGAAPSKTLPARDARALMDDVVGETSSHPRTATQDPLTAFASQHSTAMNKGRTTTHTATNTSHTKHTQQSKRKERLNATHTCSNSKQWCSHNHNSTMQQPQRRSSLLPERRSGAAFGRLSADRRRRGHTQRGFACLGCRRHVLTHDVA